MLGTNHCPDQGAMMESMHTTSGLHASPFLDNVHGIHHPWLLDLRSNNGTIPSEFLQQSPSRQNRRSPVRTSQSGDHRRDISMPITMDDVMRQQCPDFPDVDRLVISQVPLPSFLQRLEPVYNGNTNARRCG